MVLWIPVCLMNCLLCKEGIAEQLISGSEKNKTGAQNKESSWIYKLWHLSCSTGCVVNARADDLRCGQRSEYICRLFVCHDSKTISSQGQIQSSQVKLRFWLTDLYHLKKTFETELALRDTVCICTKPIFDHMCGSGKWSRCTLVWVSPRVSSGADGTVCDSDPLPNLGVE